MTLGPEKSNMRKALGLTTWLLFLLVLFLLVAVMTWFLYTVVSDGISAKMMTFESEPVEGYDYWRSNYRNAALKGWAIPMVIAALVLGYLAWRVVTTAKRILSCISGKDQE